MRTLFQQAGVMGGGHVLDLHLRGQPCIDIHPGFRRERLLGLLRQQQFEEVSYQQLSDKWRLGTNEVSLFLLKAKYKG